MKKLILVFGLLFVTQSAIAQKINWVSFEEAIALQKETPKKIMIDMYTVWCGPCKLLDKNTFQNKDVADYVNEHYYAVKFNAEGDEVINFEGKTFSNPNYNPAMAARRNSPHELSMYYRVQAYPTIVFLGEDTEFLTPVRGYKTPQQLELYLKLFKNNEHKGMASQEDFNAYFRAFKPEFQE